MTWKVVPSTFSKNVNLTALCPLKMCSYMHGEKSPAGNTGI